MIIVTVINGLSLVGKETDRRTVIRAVEWAEGVRRDPSPSEATEWRRGSWQQEWPVQRPGRESELQGMVQALGSRPGEWSHVPTVYESCSGLGHCRKQSLLGKRELIGNTV